MEYEPQQVYCDESGTTGNNLLNADQRYFSYASIAIDSDAARLCVEKVLKDYQIQGGELKAKNLLKHNRGRKAVSYILECHHEKILTSGFHKKYSLACKFFEYIFEPALTDAISTFYGVGFQNFIATLLYAHLEASTQYAEDIFADFEKMMKTLDETSATYLFSSIALPLRAPDLEPIREFCLLNRDSIQKELDTLRDIDARWILDLTSTALFTLLETWRERYPRLDVYCDRSGAIDNFLKALNTAIGGEGKAFNSPAFKLAREISPVDSINYPGIQLADVAAGATVYVLQNPGDKKAQEWGQYLHSISVLPNIEPLDMSTLNGQRNVWILHELLERSRDKRSLTDGIGEFIAGVTRHLMLQGGFAER